MGTLIPIRKCALDTKKGKNVFWNRKKDGGQEIILLGIKIYHFNATDYINQLLCGVDTYRDER